MSSGEESVADIPDEIPDIEGRDRDIETIEDQAQVETIENKDSDDEETSKRVVKPKRVVRNPQPKLNEQTLRTPKGLSAISDHFKRVKFKGKGHEEQDLNVLMKTYEYWCHRLFPKFPFDTCIARLETLGTKRSTQVLMKQIRLGLDFTDDDKQIAASDKEDAPITDGFVVDAFDNNQFDDLMTRRNEASEAEVDEEQLERMRQNRQRAEALRRQRLEKVKENTQNEKIATESTIEVENENDEVDFDNLLSTINEDDSSKRPQATLSDDENDEIHTQRKRLQTIESD